MNRDLKKQILKRIKPSKEEHSELVKKIKSLKNKLKRSAEKLDINADFVCGGSFGKGTYLKGISDVDVFVRFDKKHPGPELSSLLEKILKDSDLKSKKLKGSRDYFEVVLPFKRKKLFIEFIPVQKIKKGELALNSTDLSPFHVEFVLDKIEKDPNLEDEIRLAKQFFKAKGLYGAESYIHGFSGHVIDILLCYYDSLKNLIVRGKEWGEEKFIDISEFYETEAQAKLEFNSDKLSSLLLIDPIIKDRNAARALSSDLYAEFILACREIKELREKDFKVEIIDAKEVMSNAKEFAKKNNLTVLIYNFSLNLRETSQDIAGSKLSKLHKKLDIYFTSFDFKGFRNEFFINFDQKIALSIHLFEKTKLASCRKVIGPKVTMVNATSAFLKGKDKDYFVEEGRVCVYEKRTITSLKQVSSLSLKQCEEILGKSLDFVKSLKVLK